MLDNIITEQACEHLRPLVSHADTIICVCHRSPDGDAIGAVLGWTECLRMLGKEAQMIIPDQYPDFLHWLPNSEKIVRYDKHPSKCDMLFKIADLIVCLDFNTSSRVEEMEHVLIKSPAHKILIDHHLKPDVDADLIVSHPEASSTCELVFRVVWQLGGFQTLGRAFAIPVYCGMMTDTGGFTFNSSRPEIFFIISELLTKHIDKDKIYRNVSITIRQTVFV